MSHETQITINDATRKLAEKLDPARLLAATMRAIDKQNLETVSLIQRKYLNFPRVGPTTPEGLRNRSGSYFRSLHASPAAIVGGAVVAGIGTNVTKNGFSYPALHEFGGTVKRKERVGSVRLRTDKEGNLVRQVNGKLAVFARRKDKRTKAVAFVAVAHVATYPARAPIQKGIKDCLPKYEAAIRREIKAEVERG